MNKTKFELLELILEKVSFPSTLALFLVVGGFSLAIADPQFRPSFANLANIGLGGYLTHLVPSKKKSEDSE